MTKHRHILRRQRIETVVYDDDIFAELSRYGIGNIDIQATAERLTSHFNRLSERARKTYLKTLEMESRKVRDTPFANWITRGSRIGHLLDQYRYGELPGNRIGDAVVGDLQQISRDVVGSLGRPAREIPKNQLDGLIKRLSREGRILAHRKTGSKEAPIIHMLNNGMVIIEE